MTPVPPLKIVGTSLELNHCYRGFPRHQWGCKEHDDLQKITYKLQICTQSAAVVWFLHFPFFVQNAPPRSKLGARTRTELVSCLLKRSIYKILFYMKTTKLKHEPVNTTPLGMKLNDPTWSEHRIVQKKMGFLSVNQNWRSHVWESTSTSGIGLDGEGVPVWARDECSRLCFNISKHENTFSQPSFWQQA